MILRVTMLELVQAVMEFATSDAEVVATVVHLVNRGKVELTGNFRGCTFVAADGFPALAA